MNFPVFDLHCDTALELLRTDVKNLCNLRKNNLHIDLERAATLGGYCQCFACFTTPLMEQWIHGSPIDIFEKELEIIRRELAINDDLISQVYSSKDIAENLAKGKMSAILTIEGPAGFDYNPELLEDLYQIGFRITTLGWNESNPLTGSHKTGGGLTDIGREYVKEAQRLGMLIDVSHISDEGFWDIMDITEAPVIATHSNSRTIYNSSRNLTDEMFLEICKTGGVAGFNQYTNFIGDCADMEAVCRHFLHFIELDPSAKHIALGGDLDGCESMVEGFLGVEDYPKLSDALLKHGLSEDNVSNIFWNNAMGVIQKCCM